MTQPIGTRPRAGASSADWALAVGLFVATLTLYSFRLAQVPMYVSPDEAIIGGGAHAIASTARDVEGRFLPLYFNIQMPGEDRRGWFTPMVFYFSALFLKVLPFAEWSVRFATTVVGSINVVLTFLVARTLFESTAAAMLAAVLLMLSPAHFMLSRLELDYIYPLPFILGWLLCVASFMRDRRPRWLAAAGLCLGLGFYSYIAAVLLMPLYLVATLALLASVDRSPRVLALVLGAFAIPLTALVPWLIAHPTAIADTLGRYEVTSAANLSALQTLRSWVSPTNIDQLVSRYWNFFNPSFLFISGGQQTMFSTRQAGVFLAPMAVFLVMGIYAAIAERRDRLGWILVAGFFSAPLVALIVAEDGASQRVTPMLPFGVLLAAAGAVSLAKRRFPTGRVAALGLVALLPLQFALFARDYFGDYRLRSGPWFGGNLRGALEQIIQVEREGGVPQVFFSVLRTTGGQLDITNRWLHPYWNFYLTKHGRRELLSRTGWLDASASLDAVPKGSLVLGNVGDVATARHVQTGDLAIVGLAPEPDRDGYFLVLRRP